MLYEISRPRASAGDNPADDDAVTAAGAGPAPLGRVGDYEELRGAEGRHVRFRPDRHQRSEWMPVVVAVRATIGDELLRAEACDASENGVAFLWPDRELGVEVGQPVGELSVTFDEYEAYRGGAVVSSLRRTPDGTIAGLALVDGRLDVAGLLQARHIKTWAGPAAATDGVGGLPHARWRIAGHERFKAAVASLRLVLADAAVILDDLERSLSSPPSPVHNGNGNGAPAREALVDWVRREITPDVVALSGEIDAALRAATSRAERAALREFSRRHLHETLMRAPWMHRARHKPLGYPGDFGVMSYVYSDPFSGSTLFAKALSFSFAATPGGEAVRARKDLVKARLAALLDQPSSRPLRVLSIASGPAQEIYELLRDRRALNRPLEIVLFDQDRLALAHAHARIGGLVRGPWRDRVTVVYLHDSIKRLLLGADVLEDQGPFDAIYACGLFDYLQTRSAISLCRGLYARLASGGTLYVANMVPANPSRWFMELHLDWFLLYREAEELWRIGRTAAPHARIQLLHEATGVNPFVALTRDGA